MSERHTLKTVQPFFDKIRMGLKTFEYRKDDRNYCEGDILELCEYDNKTNTFSGEHIDVIVTFTMRTQDFLPVPSGYVIMSIRIL